MYVKISPAILDFVILSYDYCALVHVGTKIDIEDTIS